MNSAPPKDDKWTITPFSVFRNSAICLPTIERTIAYFTHLKQFNQRKLCYSWQSFADLLLIVNRPVMLSCCNIAFCMWVGGGVEMYSWNASRKWSDRLWSGKRVSGVEEHVFDDIIATLRLLADVQPYRGGVSSPVPFFFFSSRYNWEMRVGCFASLRKSDGAAYHFSPFLFPAYHHYPTSNL